MDEITVIEIAPGAFAVTGCGQYQAHDPDLPGFVSMDRPRAEAVADALRQALSTP